MNFNVLPQWPLGGPGGPCAPEPKHCGHAAMGEAPTTLRHGIDLGDPANHHATLVAHKNAEPQPATCV